MIFGGGAWDLLDDLGHGLAFPNSIYSMLDMQRLTKPAVERIQAICCADIELMLEEIPTVWSSPEIRNAWRGTGQ